MTKDMEELAEIEDAQEAGCNTKDMEEFAEIEDAQEAGCGCAILLSACEHLKYSDFYHAERQAVAVINRAITAMACDNDFQRSLQCYIR